MSRKAVNGTELNVLMVGFAVPDDILAGVCRVDRHMPVQTHKFSWSVIRALEKNGCRVDLVSSLPISTFPSGRRILIGGRRLRDSAGRFWVLLPFVNLQGLKHLTRFSAGCWSTLAWLRGRGRAGARVVLVYGTNTAHIFAAILATHLIRATRIALITDPPARSLPGDGGLVRLLRRVDRRVLRRGLSAMDGIIALTRDLVDLYAPALPGIVVEGILSSEDAAQFATSNEATVPARGGDRQFVVLYAGGLEAAYGVQILLEAFRRLEGAHCRLWICGRGSLQDSVASAAASDGRIIDYGFQPPERVPVLLRQASVLVNPRPSGQEFTRFSFPSKTIEYMASGRPVVTTRLSGIPDEYWQYVYPIDDESPEGLARLLARLRDTPTDVLDRFGARARDFVLGQKSESVQGRKICRFIAEVVAGNKAEG